MTRLPYRMPAGPGGLPMAPDPGAHTATTQDTRAVSS